MMRNSLKVIHTGKYRSNLVVSQIQSFHKNKPHKRLWLQRFDATITQFQIFNCVACQIERIRFDVGQRAIQTYQSLVQVIESIRGGFEKAGGGIDASGCQRAPFAIRTFHWFNRDSVIVDSSSEGDQPP